MRYFRLVYLLFLFALIWIGFAVAYGPDILRGAARPKYEQVIKYAIGVFLVVFFGVFAVKQFRLELKLNKTKIRKKFRFPIEISDTSPIELGAFSGEGPCFMEMTIYRKAKSANCDLFEIYRLDDGEKMDSSELGFPFDKELYNIHLENAEKWKFRLEMSAKEKLSEPFHGEVVLNISSKNPVSVLEK